MNLQRTENLSLIITVLILILFGHGQSKCYGQNSDKTFSRFQDYSEDYRLSVWSIRPVKLYEDLDTLLENIEEASQSSDASSKAIDSAGNPGVDSDDFTWIPTGARLDATLVDENGTPQAQWKKDSDPHPCIKTFRNRLGKQVPICEGILQVKYKPEKSSDKILTGFVTRRHLQSVPTAKPGENLDQLTPEVTVKSEVKKKSRFKNVKDALVEFHNTTCIKHLGPKADWDEKSPKKILFKAWKEFKSQYPQKSANRRWADKAEEVDFLTRTVLHEGHIPSDDLNIKRNLYRHDCEWKLIAQSIVNRKQDCNEKWDLDKRKFRGCLSHQNSLIGLMTEASQINIWEEKYLLRQTISSCYFNSNIQKSQFSQIQGSEDNFRAYFKYKEAYKHALRATMTVLGIHPKTGLPLKATPSENIKRLFELKTVDGRKVVASSLNSPSEKKTKINELSKIELMRDFKTYYHPQDMPPCNPKIWASLNYVRSADVLCKPDKPDKKYFYPLIKERIQLLDSERKPIDRESIVETIDKNKNSDQPIYKSFRIAINGNLNFYKKGDTNEFDDEICPQAKVNMLDLIEPAESYICLPEGKYPSCKNKSSDYFSNHRGFQASVGLLDKKHLSDISNSFKSQPYTVVTEDHRAWNNHMRKSSEHFFIGIECKTRPEDDESTSPSNEKNEVPEKNPRSNVKIKRKLKKVMSNAQLYENEDFYGSLGMCDENMILIAERTINKQKSKKPKKQ